jgi:hypothetical protein
MKCQYGTSSALLLCPEVFTRPHVAPPAKYWRECTAEVHALY